MIFVQTLLDCATRFSLKVAFRKKFFFGPTGNISPPRDVNNAARTKKSRRYRAEADVVGACIALHEWRGARMERRSARGALATRRLSRSPKSCRRASDPRAARALFEAQHPAAFGHARTQVERARQRACGRSRQLGRGRPVGQNLLPGQRPLPRFEVDRVKAVPRGPLSHQAKSAIQCQTPHLLVQGVRALADRLRADPAMRKKQCSHHRESGTREAAANCRPAKA